MRAIAIGLCLGVGWLAVSFLTENLFPVGDWRWGVTAALFFTGAGVASLWPWFWPSEKRKKRRQAAQEEAGAVVAAQAEAVARELDKIHTERQVRAIVEAWAPREDDEGS